MGIPTFFKKIIKDDPNICVNKPNIEKLYIDFNAIVYTVIKMLIESLGTSINTMSTKQIEDNLLFNIVEYLKHIICNIICPNYVYISIDGIPPMAKIIKQRSRRYKTLIETQFKEFLEKKYKTTIPTMQWTSASISPGTVFMDKLDKYLRNAISDRVFGNVSIVLSGYKNVGEGEHKIIKELYAQNNNDNKKICVYSPDADLIVLLMMTGIKNLYILRNKDENTKESEESKDSNGSKDPKDYFLFLSIDKCSSMFTQSLDIEYNNIEHNNNGLLLDYVFLTFLCGNDFVTSFSYLKIKEGSLELLESIYKKIYLTLKQNLIIDYKINFNFFKQIVYELSLVEQENLQKYQRKRHRQEKDTTVPENTWSSELNRFQHLEFCNPSHPQHDKYARLFNKIDYYKDNWITEYNNYFELTNTSDVCKEYIKSLLFCLNYYTNSLFNSGGFSWKWSYNYRNMPTFHDLYNYLNTIDSFDEINNSLNDNSKPLSPFQLLMIILPKKYFFLLPKELKDELLKPEYSKYFNTKFDIDCVQGLKYIYSEVILPEPSNIPIDIANKIKYTPINNERNIIYY